MDIIELSLRKPDFQLWFDPLSGVTHKWIRWPSSINKIILESKMRMKTVPALHGGWDDQQTWKSSGPCMWNTPDNTMHLRVFSLIFDSFSKNETKCKILAYLYLQLKKLQFWLLTLKGNRKFCILLFTYNSSILIKQVILKIYKLSDSGVHLC